MTDPRDYIDIVQDQWRRIDPGIITAPTAIIGRIRRLAQLIARQSDIVLLARGIGRAEFDILALLIRTGRPLSPSELAQDLIASGAGTTKRIKKLVDSGLVTREANPEDGRSALIHMTELGRSTIIPVLRSISAFEEELLTSLDGSARGDLTGLLRNLLVHIDTPPPFTNEPPHQEPEHIMEKSSSLKQQLIGAWRLVSYIEVPLDGSAAAYPLGEDAQGIIMYTPDGFMSAQLMATGRPGFASGDWFRGSDKEYSEEASGYIAYSGPFNVNEEDQTLTHTMDVSLYPNWLNQTQPRIVKLDGDTLELSTASPIQSQGKMANSYLIWTRAH